MTRAGRAGAAREESRTREGRDAGGGGGTGGEESDGVGQERADLERVHVSATTVGLLIGVFGVFVVRVHTP